MASQSETYMMGASIGLMDMLRGILSKCIFFFLMVVFGDMHLFRRFWNLFLAFLNIYTLHHELSYKN